MNIQRADRRMRALAIGLVALIGGGTLWLYFILRRKLFAAQTLPVLEAIEAQKELAGWFGGTIALLSIGVATLGFYLWQVGSQTVAAQRFPPPHTKVIRDTPVKFGEAAKRRGQLLQQFGAVLVIASCALIVVTWPVLKMMGLTFF